jgi:uncharacterized protein YbjT (DUF2867 family)
VLKPSPDGGSFSLAAGASPHPAEFRPAPRKRFAPPLRAAGAASFVDAEDIAAVVVAALTEDRHAGQIYELSGPRAVTLTEAVATISEATDREIRYVPLSVGDYVAELVQQGLPPADAEAFADVIGPLREGKDEYVSDGVQRALGRPPRTFAEFAKSTAAAGGWPA